MRASATSAQVRSLRSLLTLRYLGTVRSLRSLLTLRYLGTLTASATSAQARSLLTLRYLGTLTASADYSLRATAFGVTFIFGSYASATRSSCARPA